MKYHRKQIGDFDGNETFTLFDKIDLTRQNALKLVLNLEKNELPVLILIVGENQYVVNTTHRFIQLTNSVLNSIDYANFDFHKAYKSLFVSSDGKRLSSGIKTNGYVADFGLQLKDGSLIYWPIPTGVPGFAFWNVTKKCELIGRKYSSL